MNGSPIVVDTSIALKWLKPQGERHVAAATALLEQHQAGTAILHAPAHLLLEVMNALWAHRAEAAQIAQAVTLLGRLHIVFVEPDARLLSRAAELAVSHRVTVYDALFAALALDLDCELVTADRKLAMSGACPARLLG